MTCNEFGQCRGEQAATGSLFLSSEALYLLEEVVRNRDGNFHTKSITDRCVTSVAGSMTKAERGSQGAADEESLEMMWYLTLTLLIQVKL